MSPRWIRETVFGDRDRQWKAVSFVNLRLANLTHRLTDSTYFLLQITLSIVVMAWLIIEV